MNLFTPKEVTVKQYESVNGEMFNTVEEAIANSIEAAFQDCCADEEVCLYSLDFCGIVSALLNPKMRPVLEAWWALEDGKEPEPEPTHTIGRFLSVDEVDKRLRSIQVLSDDNEKAHMLEDALHQGVLKAVADGDCIDDPKELAALALESLKIVFGRHYA